MLIVVLSKGRVCPSISMFFIASLHFYNPSLILNKVENIVFLSSVLDVIW